MKVGVAGVGMVGNALSKVLKNPILYDPIKKIGSVKELNQADVVFVCVPTPGEGELFAVKEVFSILDGNKIVVIKSTVLPGTTDYLQKKYPKHKVLFNPEFLVEATAEQDMAFPDRQIIGYTDKSFNIVRDIMLILPLAPFEKIVPAKEAEMAKYFNNAFLATKVIFANQIYDICQKMDIRYDDVIEMAGADKRIGRSHLDVWHRGYRGFGNYDNSKCLPKDLDALLRFARQNKVRVPLLEEVKKINDSFNIKQYQKIRWKKQK